MDPHPGSVSPLDPLILASALALVGAVVVGLVRSRHRGALWAARGIAIAANLASVIYLVWRAGFTLDGASAWVGVPLLAAEVYWLVVSGLLAYTCWSPPARRRPPPLPDRQVAVLIATYNEDEDVLRPTVIGALGIEYQGHLRICVCDDGERGWVRAMCEELGAEYICRPAPRRHAKAGNLNHAITVVDAEFLVTLDADHVPVPGLLREMLGYFSDPEMALVQAPQSFYNRGFGHPKEAEDPLRNDQSLFFDVLMRGKDRHGAAFWCGCPSVLRREALLDVGLVATTTVVEDSHTSLLMHAAGWRSAYHHAPMAYGLAPEEISAFVVQRGRWALGMLQMLRRDPPFAKRGLSIGQRIEYTANCLHFLEVIPRLVGMVVPVLVLTLGLYPINADPALYWMLFAPQLVLVPLASWALTEGRYRPLESERFAVIRMEPYLRALSGLFLSRPAAFKVTPKGARDTGGEALRALRLPIALALAGLGAGLYQAASQVFGLPGELHPVAALITGAWVVVNAAFVAVAYRWARRVQHRRAAHRFPVSINALLTRGRGQASAIIEDLSIRGARATITEAAPRRGERLGIVLYLDNSPVEIAGTIAAVRPGRDGTTILGIAFDELDTVCADRILSWCFRNPFGEATPTGPRTAAPARVPVPAAESIALARAQAAAARTSAAGPSAPG